MTPTSPRVQGRACNTMVFTGVPKLVVIEMPKLNVTTCFQYSRYWATKLWLVTAAEQDRQGVDGLRPEVRVLVLPGPAPGCPA